jgi:hypothetical protein
MAGGYGWKEFMRIGRVGELEEKRILNYPLMTHGIQQKQIQTFCNFPEKRKNTSMRKGNTK